MFKEAGHYSINRVLPGVLFILLNLAWLATSLVLAHYNLGWALYSEFTTGTLSLDGILAAWLAGNKLVNSKYNTEPGQAGKPLGPATYLETPTGKKVVEVAEKLATTLEKK